MRESTVIDVKLLPKAMGLLTSVDGTSMNILLYH